MGNENHTAVLSPKLERAAHRCIVAETVKMGCDVLGIGGMLDHVHLVVRLAGDVSVSTLVKQIKGVSSSLLNTLREPYSERFNWQNGYAAFSLDKKHLAHAVHYVQTQCENHAKNDLWSAWEETDEPAPPTSPSSEGRQTEGQPDVGF